MTSTLSRCCLALACALLASTASAASDPQCEPYEKLRTQRDNATRTKDLKQYCGALSGMIKLMPDKPPAREKLQCEFVAATMSVDTWMGIRPSVVSTMKDTFNQLCQ